ncbi:MAG: short subunit dehydrogenase-like uncharacterized protein, partial [Saprospiraceae bacterium]
MKMLLYGATGYTGKIILAYAERYGLKPVIAGRSADKLRLLAKKYKVDYLAFDLSDHQNIVNHLQGFQAVLHCAGPFSQTAKPMVKACLESGVHYLDITGEIEVFEWIKTQHQQAVQSNICLIPGVGFDVVPTDCVAGFLHQKMPDASHLTLAFAQIGGQVSHGTATTMVENLGNQGAIREDGKIKAVPLGHKGEVFKFGDQSLFMMTIPWGDISTAYSTTGIPNIEVYTRAPKSAYRMMKFQGTFNWIFRQSFVKGMIQKNIDKKITGPNAAQRAKGKSLVLGIVQNEKGEQLKAFLKGPEGYDFTAHSALLAIKKMAQENYAPGYYTPASIFG